MQIFRDLDGSYSFVDLLISLLCLHSDSLKKEFKNHCNVCPSCHESLNCSLCRLYLLTIGLQLLREEDLLEFDRLVSSSREYSAY